MPDFLIDANLPAKISIWENERFVHVSNIDPFWDNEAIWQYAKKNNLVIISKDKDFLFYQLLKGSPPKIVHIKFGNLKLNDFTALIEKYRSRVESLFTHNLINLYPDALKQ